MGWQLPDRRQNAVSECPELHFTLSRVRDAPRQWLTHVFVEENVWDMGKAGLPGLK